MRHQRIVITVAALLLASCQKKPEAGLKDAFAQSGASPQAKTFADQAMTAFEQKDYPKAVVNLQVLRGDPTISGDQLTAVQDMMAKIQTQLAARAEAGDTQALQSLRMLQQMPRH